MKVFDFTNGKKGELLGETKRIAFTGGCLVRKGNKVFRIELPKASRGNVRWTWHNVAGFRWDGEDVCIRPEDFGVSAICFASGEFYVGCEKGEWHWHVIGTDEWNRKAVRNGMLTYSVERIVEEDEDQTAQAA